ncbi:MAG: S1 family peptidase [Myxococcaceae bacterium]
MRLPFLVPVVTALSVAACAPAEFDELVPSPEYLAHRSAIVGGTFDPGDPAVVALMAGYSVSQSQQYCTGTLVAPQTVLTAAHCINAYGTSPAYFVVFGPNADAPTADRQVIAQFKNPGYTGSSGAGHDDGVLKLASPVLTVTPIEINPVAMTQAMVGLPIRHIGYGSTSGAGSGNGQKREVTYALRRVEPYEIESGATGKQTCGGDSGGPALMVTPGSTQERVVGTISYGDPDCNMFGADTRVDVDLAWIKATYAPWEAPTCAEDGKCVAGCAVVDQDCVCIADGVCSTDCKNILRDPDCPKDCVANAVCSVQACPVPDVDCVGVGGTCTSENLCKSRECVSDGQHTGFYCSLPCGTNEDCPAEMECAPSKVCLFKQKPVGQLGELCGAEIWCQGGVCTGPVGGPMRCARTCGSQGDCPVTDSCEGGVDGTRYCRSPDAPSQPKSGTIVLAGAPAQLGPSAVGCSAAGGLPLFGLALAALGLLRRRRGGI